MDFGSSHVYSGAPFYREYDSVPYEEDVPKEGSVIEENIYERVPAFQSIEEDSSLSSSAIYDPVYEPSVQKTAVYDEVAFEAVIPERQHPIHRVVYDEVPFEAVIPERQHPIFRPKTGVKKSLSASVLQLAMMKVKGKKWRHNSENATNVVPHSHAAHHHKSGGDKPLPPVPTDIAPGRDLRPELPPPRIPPKPQIYRQFSQPNPSLQKQNNPPASKSNNVFGILDDGAANGMPVLKPDQISQSNAPSAFKSLYPQLPGMSQNYEEVKIPEPNQSLRPAPVASASSMSPAPEHAVPSDLHSLKVTDKPATYGNPKNIYASADTNIVSVNLGILQQADNSMLWAIPPARCSECEAVLLHHALAQDQAASKCRFCDKENTDIKAELLPLVGNESDITYIISQSPPVSTDDSLVVFCIDTSGSMCVTTEVQATSTHFMSRLQGVREGILTQIRRLRSERPNVRVALVTFSNMVTSYGDGSPDQFRTLDDAQLFDMDFIKEVGVSVPLPASLCNSHFQLEKTLSLLKEHGGTALGPALLLSVALASRKFGSQVILCTDGRANIGIGSLESESDYKICHNFYKETSEYGTRTGTMVSILSIEGTDCRLVELGKVAGKTAGKVKVVKCEEMANDFGDVISSSLMATKVSVNVVTQKQLFFQESEEKHKQLVKSFVGNATPDTEVTFKYGVTDNTAQSALFQLQVQYYLANGCTCLRVITQSRPVTENRLVAEGGMNPTVVGTYASQLASKLALDGALIDAALTAEAHKDLLNRAKSIRSNDETYEQADERIYGSVCYQMEDLNTEISKVASSVKPSAPVAREKPLLPPRIYQQSEISATIPSAPMLPLPNVPNTPLVSKEKLKEAVENCPDDIANKLYKHRNACGKMFTAM